MRLKQIKLPDCRPGTWNGDSSRHRAPVLREGRKSTNIHANPGFIWGISATYIPPVSYKDLGLLDEDYSNEVLSELGFLHAPATHQLGGILVKGEIQRKTVLNLTALRDIGGDDRLHRYLPGLALVALTHARPYNLRQGCLLVHDAEKQSVMKLVNYDGTETELTFDPSAVLAYAQNAAKAFGVGESRTVKFD